jgi:hypothetical protein
VILVRFCMTSFGDLPASLFSPSKVIYISYVILTGLKILAVPSLTLFVVLSVAFWLAEICHNDYLRPWLNKKADAR